MTAAGGGGMAWVRSLGSDAIPPSPQHIENHMGEGRGRSESSGLKKKKKKKAEGMAVIKRYAGGVSAGLLD